MMADLLEWHQRESRPEWFVHYEQIEKYDEQNFIESGDCLGGLRLVGPVGTIDKSTIWRFNFPADQDHKFAEGDKVYDPRPAHDKVFDESQGDKAESQGDKVKYPRVKELGKIVALDDTNGTIDVKIGNRQGKPTAIALVPSGPINDEVIREALQRLARSLLDTSRSTHDATHWAAIALLRREPPRFRNGNSLDPNSDESASARFVRLAAELDNSCLVVQGPPGSGKTWALARAVLRCVAADQLVGLSGFKHETIKAMIAGIREALADSEVRKSLGIDLNDVKIVRKIKDDEKPEADDSGLVSEVKDNDLVYAALTSRSHQIAAGTAWLFSREEMPQLDVVFIDEAGQMSLANALAIATSAKNVVLVGDPQQLAQPGKGAHPLLPPPADEWYPYGSSASALEHVLAGRATVPEDEGVFLDVTFRLHPEIRDFISAAMYDGRLASADHCRNRAISLASGKRETGIRWCPVEHTGNKTSSSEEVAAIAKIVRQFNGATLTTKEGRTRPIDVAKDFMIVTPYNSQANDLRRAMPKLRIGTIDKFQGLEAPIVIVSMVASTSEDIPRGLDFLYSTNRLNVAVSRAKTLCIVVGSPNLLAARCNSVKQMQLVNVLCKYVEMAGTWT